MNKLFNNGDCVLLNDCKAFDEKHGLDKDTTMWDVARKMRGGDPDENYMLEWVNDVCVGLSEDEIGCWEDLPKDNYSTRLSVEDVLYRSEDGLTLDELSKIHGAFEEGKEYECMWASNKSCAYKGRIYTANGDGIVVMGITCNRLNLCKFKPVTPKKQWVPKVGEYVMVGNTPKLKYMYIGLNSSGSAVAESLQEKNLGQIKCFHLRDLKPIDKQREDTIKKVTDLAETPDDNYTARDFAIALYDAGMLKINHP